MFKKITLKNGLRIVTAPMQGTQAVTVLVLVGAGSKYENKKNNGISHFLEHMFFKGTKKRPQTLDIASDLDRVGGEYNAFTADEITGYWAKVDFKHLDLALDVVSDIFLNSLLKEKEIEREKGVIVEEINMYQDIPMQFVGYLFEKCLYGDQPAGWLIIGNKENVAGFKRDDFVKYLNQHYSASNTVICLAGNLENSKLKTQSSKVQLKTQNYFRNIKTGKSKSKKKVIEEQKEPKQLIHWKKTDQTHLCLGVRAYDLFHSDKYALRLLGLILGGNMSSRLFISIRERQGLAYYIRTNVENQTDTGYLVTQAGVDNNKVTKAINSILAEYKKIREKKISNQELNKAKECLKGRMFLELESSDANASFLAGQEILKEKILTPEEIFAKIDKVAINDIQKVARDIFIPEKLNLALIGPIKKKISMSF